MSRAQLLKGAQLIIDGKECVLLRLLQSGRWQIEERQTGEIRNIEQNALLKMYLAGQCRFVMDLAAAGVRVDSKRKADALAQFELLTPHQKDEARARLTYVRSVREELGDTAPVRLLDAAIAKIHARIRWPEAVPHRTTVWRWMRRYDAAGQDIRGLVYNTAGRGNRDCKMSPELKIILKASIDQIFMTNDRGSAQDVLDHARTEVNRGNKVRLPSEQIPMPKLRQVNKLIGEIPLYDRCTARYGKAAADRRFRNVTSNVKTQRPLQRAEIDHTRMDVFVVDDETMLPLGRPWLTLCVDFDTRSVLGYDLSFEPPSQASVARCLRHALLPKVASDHPGSEQAWPMYGVMETLVVDNGAEFHAESLEVACLSLGITLQYCPRKQPWYKGCVERTLGSLNRGVAHRMPGTTFSNIVEKGDYDPAKHAVVTLDTLRAAINVWITDYYHQRIHKTMQDTPDHAWRIGTAGMAIPLPANPKELVAHLGLTAICQLSHKGVENNRLFYNSPELGEVARSHGGIKVRIRYHDDNLGSVYVLDPTSQTYFEVRAVDFDYANGLTAWQHQVCRRFAKRCAEQYSDPITLAEAKRRIRELILQDFQRKKQHGRSRHARFMNSPTPLAPLPNDEPPLPSEEAKPSPTPVSIAVGSKVLTPLVALKTKRLHNNCDDVE